jgi:hypothetical protein
LRAHRKVTVKDLATMPVDVIDIDPDFDSFFYAEEEKS